MRLGGHTDPAASVELYDLSVDRGETRDVANEYPQIVEQIRAVMESRTPSEVPEWNFPVPAGTN